MGLKLTYDDKGMVRNASIKFDLQRSRSFRDRKIAEKVGSILQF
jgi:hypothetical protein